MTKFQAALAASLLAAGPALAAEEAPDICSYLSVDEVNAFTNVPASATRANPTKNGNECTYLDSGKKAVFVVEVRPAKLPKAELDMEAESLQKIYRTSVKPIPDVGDGGFWLTSKQELYFRKGKYIVRVVLVGSKDPKAGEAKSASAGRLIETRLPK